MPYKKTYKKRNKKYNKRLADKKINTLVEKRIDEISKKNIEKNKQWLYNGAYIKNSAIAKFSRFGYDFEDGFQLSYNGRTGSGTNLPQCAVMCLSAIGNQPAMIQRGAHVNANNFENTFTVNTRKVFSYLRAENRTENDVTICATIVYVPNDAVANANQVGVENITNYNDGVFSVCGGNPAQRWKGNFRKLINTYEAINPSDSSNSVARPLILKRKTFKLPGVKDSGKSGTSNRKFTSTYRDITMTHLYKRNKKMTYVCKNILSDLYQVASEGNFYLVVTSDLGEMLEPGQRLSDVRIQGIGGIEYCLQAQALPNNNINPSNTGT